MYYVYLIHRNTISIPICCSDFIGKVGKGSNDRKNAYRTPYGTKNLQIDTWNCDTERQALDLEGIILNLLDARGWLSYHSSGKRSEVISFPLKGNNQSSMIKEYLLTMKYIHTLICKYHSMRSNDLWSDIITRCKEIPKSIHENRVESTLYIQVLYDKNTVLYTNNEGIQSIQEKKASSCLCM